MKQKNKNILPDKPSIQNTPMTKKSNRISKIPEIPLHSSQAKVKKPGKSGLIPAAGDVASLSLHWHLFAQLTRRLYLAMEPS